MSSDIGADVRRWLETSPAVTSARLGKFLTEVADRDDVAFGVVRDHITDTDGVLVRFGDTNDGRTMNVLARVYFVHVDDDATSVVRIGRTTRSAASITEVVTFGRAWVAMGEPVIPAQRDGSHEAA